MAKLSRNLSTGVLDPRENLFGTGTLGALNAEIQIDCDGCSTVSIDLRGTFSHTVQIQGTIDGTNWSLIPVRPTVGGVRVLAIVGTASGTWMGSCTGYRKVRALATAYVSGGSTATLMASNALFDDFAANGSATPLLVTAVGASGAAVTLTLPAPGIGLRQYVTYLSINRFAVALLTAGAAPVTVTTTNIPGTLAFSFPADAAAQGTIDRWREDFSYPIMGTAQNTALTVVCPATPNVIWRVTGGYFVAP
jgi:hypothetical protein